MNETPAAARFVVLSHDRPFPHFDFMLERDGSLLTWRLLSEPASGGPIAAQRLPDHRLTYLDYEGPVSGNRGAVVRWDAGTFEWIESSPDVVHVRLDGARLMGEATIKRSEDDSETDLCRFELIENV